MTFPLGTRVRMVQTNSTGVVFGELNISEIDGGHRIPVQWDSSGKISQWHPDFLRLADTNEKDDPDEVVSGNAVRRRGHTYFDKFGVLIVVPEGFSSV